MHCHIISTAVSLNVSMNKPDRDAPASGTFPVSAPRRSGLRRLRFNQKKYLIPIIALIIGLGVLGYYVLLPVITDDEEQASQKAYRNYTEAGRDLIINATVPDNATTQERSTHEQNVAADLEKYGDKKGALDRYKAAIELTPNDPSLLVRAAALAEELNDGSANGYYRKALSLLRDAATKDPGVFPTATYYGVAEVALKANDENAAREYFQKTIDAAREAGDDAEANAYRTSAEQELDKL